MLADEGFDGSAGVHVLDRYDTAGPIITQDGVDRFPGFVVVVVISHVRHRTAGGEVRQNDHNGQAASGTWPTLR